MLCYLARMEPYYLKCIKDGPFQPKTAKDDAKPESQWTPDEKRVVVQDQLLKSIIMPCLPDDIMKFVISYVSAKETWADLVHSFEGPSNTKENRIMDLKLEYQTFRAKSTKSLSQTDTCYKTLLNELANDGFNLSKHEINIGFVNSLPEKWLTFSHGLRNDNHTQTLDLADIYGRFVYKDNLIQRRHSDTKKALITTLSSTPISTVLFFNNVIQDFQENSDDEVDERSSEEYLRDLDIKNQERAPLANSKRFIKRRNNFSDQKANENTEHYKCGNKGHFTRDCFSKTFKPSYKSPVNNYSSVSKGFQPKFTPKLIQSFSNSNSQADPKFQKDYKAKYKKIKDEEEVSDEEEVTHVKVLMALADDELTVGESHARNGEWVDITIRKVNTLLSMDEDADCQNYLKYINIDLKFVKDQRLNLLSKYNKMDFELNKCRDELLILKQAKLDVVTFQIENTELTKLNHALQEQLKEERKINEKWLTSSKKVSQCIRSFTKLRGNAIDLSTPLSKRETRLRILYCMICKKKDHRTSDHEMYTATLKKRGELPQDTIHVEALYTPLLTKMSLITSKEVRKFRLQRPGSPPKSGFTKETNPSLLFVHRRIREPISYLDSGCSRSMPGVKSYLHKYVEQPYPKVVFGDNSSCITEGYGSINRGGVVFTKVVFVNGLKYNLISISQLYDAKYIIQFDDKQGTILNANKEIVLIAPRRNDVYVLEMSSLTPNEACFFAKSSEISPISINHEKYTLVIVDEYSRTDNGIEFRNHELKSFCDEKGISQKFSSPYTLEQNGVAERKNKTLIEAARTMLNGSDHLGKFDAKSDDGYLLGYSFVSKAFRVFNTRRQQVEETYHATFDEIMEAIRFTNTPVDEIGIDDSSRYPPDEFLHEDDPSRQYQVDSDDTEGPPDLINTEGTHEQNIQNDQMITQPTNIPSGNNTEVSGSITESLVSDVTQSHILNLASTNSHPVPQDRWSRDQHIELVNIIGDYGKGMLTRSMAVKLTAALASECLFADFFSKIEPKKVSGVLKHLGWVDSMQEEVNQFYKNKVWSLVPLPYGKIAIGSKWVFKNKKDEHGITIKNKAKLVAQGYSQEEGIDYDKTFAPVARRKPSGYSLHLPHT
ncbi:retrovirus-related pol polyprotein from transposon TNT 1-94 [Tanacetum coccineum]|uniref:Retrovirus-related pol polyprotein from transposon TNT 1-94 n=1 Tax=Tanacetum coccineum TaxID=301880 RepID=A0ABQ5GBA0_9ASTR